MSDFKAKMHQIQFRLGLCPRPRWVSLSAPPDLLAIIWGSTSKERREERKGMGRGKGGEGREKGRGGEKGGEGKRKGRGRGEGRGKEEGDGKGRGKEPPPTSCRPL